MFDLKRDAVAIPGLQPAREFHESQRKKKKVKSLSFAFFPFLLLFGIEPFQWVTAEKSRKNFLPFSLAREVAGRVSHPRARLHSRRRRSQAGFSSDHQHPYSYHFRFWQDNSGLL
jgi:hypothetical protein